MQKKHDTAIEFTKYNNVGLKLQFIHSLSMQNVFDAL